jgi:hypothetical protein
MGETPVYEDCKRMLIRSRAHIIPGPDRLVPERYPAAGHGLDGIAVRLDADPLR